MDEFSVIQNYFQSLTAPREDVVFGIGDDCACVEVPLGQQLLISTDTLIAGVHFPLATTPHAIGYKAAMVNMSDLAAMGGMPCWASLALTMPEVNTTWLAQFAQGLKDALNPYQVALIGGDTTRGPLSVTLTLHGLIPEGKALRRKNAKPQDKIFVSDGLGGASLALRSLKEPLLKPDHQKILLEKLNYPKAEVELGVLLRSYASSAIDISDGLAADLEHICLASGVGAMLLEEDIPLHPLLKTYLGEDALSLALQGGDDYALCFTIPPENLEAFQTQLTSLNKLCYCIGTIEKKPGLRLKTRDHTVKTCRLKGYTHF
jgi:thiamine-monophosphate kinase